MIPSSSSPARLGAGPPAPLITPAFVRLGLADLAYFTAAGVAIYALPLQVTGPVGAGEAGAGLAFGAFAVSALVLRPVAGRLADRRGRRPLLIGGAMLCALVMLLTVAADTLAMVVGLRVLLGIAEAAFFVASLAALADLAPPSRTGEALSYNSLGLYLGLAGGPPLGEVLVESLGLPAAWYGAAALGGLAAAVALSLPETGEPRKAPRGPIRLVHRPAIGPALGFLAAVAAMGGFLAFASLQARTLGLTSTSLPLVVYGGVVVAGRLGFARLPDRLPALPLGAVALSAIAAGSALIAAWVTPAGLIIGTAILALGVTFSTPAFFTAVFAVARPEERGAASGTMSAALDLGLGAGPILLGLAAERAGIPAAFGLAALLASAGGGWTLTLARRAR